MHGGCVSDLPADCYARDIHERTAFAAHASCRTGNNVMFRSVSLASAAWPQGKDAIRQIPLIPAQEPWAIDKTDALFLLQK
jgi:hypothetical protein